VVKSRVDGYWYVTRMRETANEFRIFIGNQKERTHSGDLGIIGSIGLILKLILTNSTGFID